jgi:nucleoside-diphosphate-sugar epimerase
MSSAGLPTVVLKRSTSRPWRISKIADVVESCDVDKVPLSEVFSRWQIDAVVHAAVDYGRGYDLARRLVESNIAFPLEIAELALQSGADLFVNAHTFSDMRPLGMGFPYHYAISKRQLVEWLRYLSPRIAVCNLTLQFLYGPRDADEKFVPWLLRSLLEGKSDIPLTRGAQRRDFVYVDDAARAFRTIISQRAAFKGYSEMDVGTGIHTRLRDFVRLAARLIEKVTQDRVRTRIQFGALPYRPDDPMNVHTHLKKLKSLGWAPEVGLEEGLLRTIAWYRERK